MTRPSAEMELRHMRYFRALAEELHFGRTAERLGISAPTLSVQIATLERLLSARLFYRTKRSVLLTEAGRRFYSEISPVIEQLERAQMLARSAGRGEIGEIEVGYVSSAALSGIMTRSVSEYRRKHPKVSIHFQKMETAAQIQSLREHRLDLCFVRAPDGYPEGITGKVLSRSNTILALPEGHPKAAQMSIVPKSLVGERFVTTAGETDGGVLSLLDALADTGHFHPEIVEQAPDIVTIVTLVATGYGIAALPAWTMCLGIPGVLYRPIDGAMPVTELAVAFRKNERSPATRALIDSLRRVT